MLNPRILLVEDNEAVLFGYSKYLSKKGFQVATAVSCKTAREKMLKGYYHAILLDLRLPDGDGMNLIAEIKTNTPSTAIIVATGVDDVATAVQATKQGADNYLTKPIDMPELEVSLKKSVELESLRRKNFCNRSQHICQDYPCAFIFSLRSALPLT